MDIMSLLRQLLSGGMGNQLFQTIRPGGPGGQLFPSFTGGGRGGSNPWASAPDTADRGMMPTEPHGTDSGVQPWDALATSLGSMFTQAGVGSDLASYMGPGGASNDVSDPFTAARERVMQTPYTGSSSPSWHGSDAVNAFRRLRGGSRDLRIEGPY